MKKIWQFPRQNIPIARGLHLFTEKLHEVVIGETNPETIMLPDEKYPSNLLYLPLNRLKANYELRMIPDSNGEVIITGNNPMYPIAGDFYCSIGLQPNLNVTQDVSEKDLTMFPSDYRKQSPKYSDWVHPKGVPTGSLVEATLRWAHITNNLDWAYECTSYHAATTIDFIANRFQADGISLCYQFFNNLSLALSQENKVPSLDNMIQIYQKTYADTYESVSQERVEKIKEILVNLEHERSEQFSIQSNMIDDDHRHAGLKS